MTSRCGRTIALASGLVVSTGAPLSAHDLFFRPSTFVVRPGSTVVVDVLNGTFSSSENAVARERLADLSLVTPAGRTALDRAGWSEAHPKSTVPVPAGEPGTYVLGAAVKPRLLSLPGKQFGAYLKEEALDDVLASRAAQGRLDEPSRERYSKYVKALLQVGDRPSDGHAAVLGYAAEIVPEQNPYRLKPGDVLTLRCLVDGRPYAGRKVLAGGRRGTSDLRLPALKLATDAEGRVRVKLNEPGAWYVKFVAMAEVNDGEANYESKWATLTFAVR